MYSLAFGAATAAPAAGADSAVAPQQGRSLQHRMAPAAIEQGGQHRSNQQQPASPTWCTDIRSVGAVVEHPWQDPLIAALRAGRTSALPPAAATIPVLDTPSTASGQLPDGFDAAVTAVLDTLGEAVRVRCQCIDERVGQADGSTCAELPATSDGAMR